MDHFNTQTKGKMIDVGGHVILLMLVILGPAATIDINPDLYKNTLRSNFGINYKYNGLVKNSIDRVWAVVEVDVPTLAQIPLGHTTFDETCAWTAKNKNFNYLDLSNVKNVLERVNIGKSGAAKIRPKELMLHILCKEAVPWINFIMKKRKDHMSAIRGFFNNNLYILFPELRPEPNTPIRRTKRGIGALLFTAATGLITLGVEAISTHLQNKRNKAINKAMLSMKAETERNRARISSIGSDFLVYGKYDTASTKKIMQTIRNMQSRQTQIEKIFIEGNYQESSFQPYLTSEERNDLILKRASLKQHDTPLSYMAVIVVNLMLQTKEENDN